MKSLAIISELMMILAVVGYGGVAVMLLGGEKKIPELAEGFGQGMRNFRTALEEEPSAPEVEEA
jgi:Sec-independent protein translocase protein TatA